MDETSPSRVSTTPAGATGLNAVSSAPILYYEAGDPANETSPSASPTSCSTASGSSCTAADTTGQALGSSGIRLLEDQAAHVRPSSQSIGSSGSASHVRSASAGTTTQPSTESSSEQMVQSSEQVDGPSKTNPSAPSSSVITVNLELMKGIDQVVHQWEVYGASKHSYCQEVLKLQDVLPPQEQQQTTRTSRTSSPNDPKFVDLRDPLDLNADPEMRPHRTQNFSNFGVLDSKDVHWSPFVGLINQGSTCYLNSLLQALYHTPPFSRTILEWDYLGQRREQALLEQRAMASSSGEIKEPLSRQDQQRNNHRSLLLKEEFCIPRQLQLLFTRMYLSRRRCIPTVQLTKSFRWNERDVFTQHDISELICLLFGALEQTIPEKSAEALLSMFKGSFVDRLTCLNCSRQRRRYQPFYEIPVDITSGNLVDALRKFCEPEKMDSNVFCEHCNTKTPTEKRTQLGKVPSVLLLQLMRFSFDIQLLQRVKSHAPFAFPPSIDINPYADLDTDVQSTGAEVKEANSSLPPYILTSVILHSGSASSGHYYAYIRTHRNSWSRFDDDRVSSIDNPEVVIPLTTFGDLSHYASVLPALRQPSSQPGVPHLASQMLLSTSTPRTSSASAYLLCYIRADLLSDVRATFEELLNPATLPSVLFNAEVPFTCSPEMPMKLPKDLEAKLRDSGIIVNSEEEEKAGYKSASQPEQQPQVDSAISISANLVDMMELENTEFVTNRVAAITDARTYRPKFYIESGSARQPKTPGGAGEDEDEPQRLSLKGLDKDLSFDRSVPVRNVLLRLITDTSVRSQIYSRISRDELASCIPQLAKAGSLDDIPSEALLPYCRLRKVSPSLGWAYEPLELDLPIGHQSATMDNAISASAASLFAQIREETPVGGGGGSVNVADAAITHTRARSLAKQPDLLLEVRSSVSSEWLPYHPDQLPMLVHVVPPSSAITILKAFAPFHPGKFGPPLAALLPLESKPRPTLSEAITDAFAEESAADSSQRAPEEVDDAEELPFSRPLPDPRLMHLSLDMTLSELRTRIASKIAQSWLPPNSIPLPLETLREKIQLHVGKPVTMATSDPGSACPLRLLPSSLDEEKLSSPKVGLRPPNALYIELPLENMGIFPSELHPDKTLPSSYLIAMWQRSHALITILFNKLPPRDGATSSVVNEATSRPSSAPVERDRNTVAQDTMAQTPEADIKVESIVTGPHSTEDLEDDPIYTESIQVSPMITLGDLKQMIADRLGVDVNCFQCSRSQHASQFKDPNRTLKELELVHRSGVYLTWGRPLQPHEFQIAFSLYHPNTPAPLLLNRERGPSEGASMLPDAGAGSTANTTTGSDAVATVPVVDSSLTLADVAAHTDSQVPPPAPSPTNQSEASLASLRLAHVTSTSSAWTRTSSIGARSTIGGGKTTRSALLNLPVSELALVGHIKLQILDLLSKLYPPSQEQIEAAAAELAMEDAAEQAEAEAATAAAASSSTTADAAVDEATLAEAAAAAAAFNTTVEAILAQRREPSQAPQVPSIPRYRGLPNALGIRHFRIRDRKGKLLPDTVSLKAVLTHVTDGMNLLIQPTRRREQITKNHRLITLREWHPPTQSFGTTFDLVCIPSITIEQLAHICTKFRLSSTANSTNNVDIDSNTGVEYGFIASDEALAECKALYESIEASQRPVFAYAKGKLSGPTTKADIPSLSFQVPAPSTTIRASFRIVLGGDVIIFKGKCST